jgi:hypothetical protein
MTLIGFLLGGLTIVCIVWAVVTSVRAKTITRQNPTFAELFSEIERGSFKEKTSIYTSVRRQYGEQYALWLFELYTDCLTGKKTIPFGTVNGRIV